MPFRNLKFLIILNKALGLTSCKLVNGRLKPSSTWSCGFCMIWVLIHFSYTAIFYYTKYNESPDKKAKKEFALSIIRYSTYFISLLPYHFVAAFWSKDIVKVSAFFILNIARVLIKSITGNDKYSFLGN